MKKVNLLSRAGMKEVMGGGTPPAGECITCNCDSESSCWYSTTGYVDLCNRVCGVGKWSDAIVHGTCPSNCRMN